MASFSSVLLPEPATPKIAFVSPCASWKGNLVEHNFFIECDGDIIKLDGAARRVGGGRTRFFAR